MSIAFDELGYDEKDEALVKLQQGLGSIRRRYREHQAARTEDEKAAIATEIGAMRTQLLAGVAALGFELPG